MESTMNYAGFWRRFVAWIIDGIINVAVLFIIRLLFIGFGTGTAESIAGTVLQFIYTVLFWTWRGQTPGKMVMGVKIIKTDGSAIGIGRAILRFIGYWVSIIIIFIGFLMIAWDSRKQGLHDKIAGTYVIRTR